MPKTHKNLAAFALWVLSYHVRSEPTLLEKPREVKPWDKTGKEKGLDILVSQSSLQITPAPDNTWLESYERRQAKLGNCPRAIQPTKPTEIIK